MQAALMLRAKSRERKKQRLKRGIKNELPSNVATKPIAPFPRYPPASWGVLNSTILGRVFPAAPLDSFDVVYPPGWGLTNAAFTGAGLPYQHLGDPNVHQFSELCAPPIATSASRLVGLCR
ncbi:jg13211 [Pararge aegeria aegeria]|uniref:Jg13211 protein n=1 Tax=Pararge aegeria aegeria TaxID=348720 RepID=A0A8S4RGS9_9NEOP|nr:jg13211 [Pararge aegeria aegeria]